MPETKSGNREGESTTTDSLTFGQLTKVVAQQRSQPKEAKYAFEYSNNDTLSHELEDWHEYSEEAAIASMLTSFNAQFPKQSKTICSQACVPSHTLQCGPH